MVFVSRGCYRIAAHAPCPFQTRIYRVFHRFFGVGKIHYRQCLDGQADGNGRSPGDAAGRRYRPQEPQLRAGLLERAPRPQHPPHRLCRLRDHQERRYRHLCADCALCHHPSRRARGCRGGTLDASRSHPIGTVDQATVDSLYTTGVDAARRFDKETSERDKKTTDPEHK